MTSFLIYFRRNFDLKFNFIFNVWKTKIIFHDFISRDGLPEEFYPGLISPAGLFSRLPGLDRDSLNLSHPARTVFFPVILIFFHSFPRIFDFYFFFLLSLIHLALIRFLEKVRIVKISRPKLFLITFDNLNLELF